MRLRLPHFANTLLFRISATFLLLLGISLGGYYFWIDHTVFNPYQDAAEEDWYENLADAELDSLASRLADLGADTAPAEEVLHRYSERAARFRAELLVFDPAGRYLSSTAPGSLSLAVPRVPADLLHDMHMDDWDFGSYPVPDEIDAFENRIFNVEAISSADGQDVIGYLVASFLPLDIASEDLNSDSRLIEAQENIFKALIGLLIYSAVTALLIMAWTGRRVQRLNDGVEAFAAGDFATRVPTRSTDEIGTLGRNFNTMAERIQTMVAELRQKEQFQRQLVANVSHDLRTPMASMRGYVETLLMDDAQLGPDQRQRYLNIITGNLDHLNRLVEHTLVLSRFDSGQATFRFEDFPLAELADSILLRFEGLAASQDVKLTLEVDAGVGLVHADPLQIAQVLQNLVENGIKFNRSGGRLGISLTRQGERVGLEVRDTGCGIPPADLPYIFDRFFTADKSRKRQMTAPDAAGNSLLLGQSSGLGLAIAAKIVSGHNSLLQVESTVDQGTVFRFQLPHVAGEAREAAGGA